MPCNTLHLTEPKLGSRSPKDDFGNVVEVLHEENLSCSFRAYDLLRVYETWKVESSLERLLPFQEGSVQSYMQ